MMCKEKGGYKREHYDVKLNGRMDKGGHYDVQMKRWMQNRAL